MGTGRGDCSGGSSVRLEDWIVIDCAPKPLYEIISDVEGHTTLLPGYSESKIIEHRPNGNVILQREAVIHGRRRRWKSEVSFEEGKTLRFRQLEGPLTDMKVAWSLEPIPQGTRFRIIHDVDVRPWWKKWWMEQLIAKPAIEATARTVLKAIKVAAEARSRT